MTNISVYNQLFSTDERYNNCYDNIKSGNYPNPKLRDFRIRQGKIYHKDGRLVLKKEQIKDTLTQEYEKNKELLMGQSILSSYKYITSKYLNVTRKDVQNFLMSIPQYALTYNPYKVVNKPFVSLYPNHRHQVDLIQMGHENFNRNYEWIYVQVDQFSRKCWLRPIKTQSAEEARQCLLSVLHEMNTTPIILSTDNGGSFKDVFDQECEDAGIKHIFSNAH